MQKRKYFLPFFLICVFVTCLLFLLGHLGGLRFFTNTVGLGTFSVGSSIKLPSFPNDDQKKISQLQKQNSQLSQKLVTLQQLQEDNKALRDQFENTTISSKTLIPTRIVGRSTILPTVTTPEFLIVDKGEKDGITKGQTVIYENSAVGQVVDTSDFFSKVQVISSKQTSFSGKDGNTNALGVVQGNGNGEILFGNVLLSDTLSIGDMIVSGGNQDMSGKGYPPGLFVGKITGVEKNPSSLFQRAKVATPLEFEKLTTVFIMQ